MPSTFIISPACSVSFVINTGDGFINGAPTDFVWLNQDTKTFWNCQNKNFTKYCQDWMWGDEIIFQFIYENTDTGIPPIVEITNPDGSHVAYATPVDATTVHSLTAQNVWNVTIDTSELPEPTDCDCYVIKIGGLLVDDTNLFACGDFGTFEAVAASWGASTGGNSSLSRDTLHFRTGTHSAIIYAAGPPSLPGSLTIFQCNSPTTYTSGQYYKYSGWVRFDDDETFVHVGESVGWDISTLSDATEIYRSDAVRDLTTNWLNFVLIFLVNSDVSGTPKILSTDIMAAGFLNLDDLAYYETNLMAEAVSQDICICKTIECGAQIFYTPETDKTEMGIVGFGITGLQSFNVTCDFSKWKINDESNATERQSDGNTDQIVSFPEKIYSFRAGPVPSYMAEKIVLAVKFANVLVRPSGNLSGTAIYMVAFGKEPTLEWIPESGLVIVEWEMVPAYYPWQKSNC